MKIDVVSVGREPNAFGANLHKVHTGVGYIAVEAYWDALFSQ